VDSAFEARLSHRRTTASRNAEDAVGARCRMEGSDLLDRLAESEPFAAPGRHGRTPRRQILSGSRSARVESLLIDTLLVPLVRAASRCHG
jgi:hypothetical protein